MTSHPSRSYTLKTSSARPPPYVSSTAIVRTLCVATLMSRPRARARFLVSLCRRSHRSALPRRLRLRANNFLFSVTFSIIPLSLSPLLPCILVLRRGFSHPTLCRPAHLPFTARIWCVLSGSSPPCHFPRWYASFGVMALNTNALTYGFHWQCTTDAIGYAVMVTARLGSLPSPYFHGLGPPRTGGSRGSREK